MLPVPKTFKISMSLISVLISMQIVTAVDEGSGCNNTPDLSICNNTHDIYKCQKNYLGTYVWVHIGACENKETCYTYTHGDYKSAGCQVPNGGKI